MPKLVKTTTATKPHIPDHADRQTILTNKRNAKTARSAHAYVRGNTAKFYDWLNDADIRNLPEGPAIWICGDCHTGNLSPVADAQGKIDVQIRDLDQTVIGNPAHDLIRLGFVAGNSGPRVGARRHHHYQHDRSTV